MRANMRAFYRLLGERSPGGQVVERHGLLAAVVPSSPDRSVLNAVVYERAEELAAAYSDLARSYYEAGVRAWTVWVPEVDRAASKVLQDHGHALDAVPRAMTLDLRDREFVGAGAIDWEHTEDVGSIASINETAYGL